MIPARQDAEVAKIYPLVFTDPTGLAPENFYANLGKGGDTSYSNYSDGIEPRKQNELPNASLACKFASLQFGATNSLGLLPLTESQQVNSKNELANNGLVGANWGTNNKSLEIIESALRQKGLPDSFKAVKLTDPLEIEQHASFSVRNVSAFNGTVQGGHYNAGDGEGGFLWDPMDGFTDTGREDNNQTEYYTIVKETKVIEYGPNGRTETTSIEYNPDVEEYSE
jgi:hypothetical protein